jgi:outer membrane lipoprotein-sorting protein
MKSKTFLLLLAILPNYLMAAPPLPSSTTAEAVDGPALLQKVVTTYQSLTSYQDSGRNIQTLGRKPPGDNPPNITIEFKTYFKRSDKFLFSWISIEDLGDGIWKEKNAIWSDGKKAWSSYSYDHNVSGQEENFGMASAEATGITNGASHDIFRLLTDKVTGTRLDQLKDLNIVGSEKVFGIDSYIVRGKTDLYMSKLWIGKSDYIIRRGMDTWSDGTTMTFERTGIILNQDIPDERFTWNPSK